MSNGTYEEGLWGIVAKIEVAPDEEEAEDMQSSWREEIVLWRPLPSLLYLLRDPQDLFLV